ncbi:MAG: branched-chain amino acid aminotransferase [Rhodospirillales bacterium]|nr:branched-chain amino acid aminotransferase [Rhodospirillales bacterium]
MGKSGGGDGITFVDGQWLAGDPKVLGAHSHAIWLASVVFDGARSLAGMAPDLDRHCARVIKSAELLGLRPMLTADQIEDLAWQGIRQFPSQAELYICPMFFAESGFVTPDPDSTRFVMTVRESPLPPGDGFSACLSSYRRPARDMAPTEAKASCLYPNVARVGAEAKSRGFDSAVVRDPNGNVAEFAYMNLFFAKDDIVYTPSPNGTFLNGITRQRVISLLREAGTDVVERAVYFEELLTADEIFATGNYAKVQPCTRIGDRDLPAGPITRQARALYFEFARTCVRPA